MYFYYLISKNKILEIPALLFLLKGLTTFIYLYTYCKTVNQVTYDVDLYYVII